VQSQPAGPPPHGASSQKPLVAASASKFVTTCRVPACRPTQELTLEFPNIVNPVGCPALVLLL
jgi:hypothetical protein